MSDKLKQLTNKAYTASDLNCPRYYHVKCRQLLERIFKKKAKRKMKRELQKELEELNNEESEN